MYFHTSSVKIVEITWNPSFSKNSVDAFPIPESHPVIIITEF